jgi:hypothetical protein
MKNNDFLLSVEEIALAMSMVDKPDAAHGLMAMQLGDMSQEEARIRLMTAGHSLIARGFLSIDEEAMAHLAAPLARVARVLTGADYSIRCSRSYPEADIYLSFHFGEGGIFAHAVEQGVVHHVVELEGTDDVLEGGLAFFEMGEMTPFSCPSAEIPDSLLTEVKDEEDVTVVGNRLKQAGVAEETQVLLAEDLAKTLYRGSILRVEYDEDNQPISNRGLLVLRGQERLWFLRPSQTEGETMVTVLPGTEEVFRREATTLF